MRVPFWVLPQHTPVRLHIFQRSAVLLGVSHATFERRLRYAIDLKADVTPARIETCNACSLLAQYNVVSVPQRAQVKSSENTAIEVSSLLHSSECLPISKCRG